jgi:hypothetical protein
MIKTWQDMPHGIYTPFVQNTMSRAGFTFIRRYLHFADNNTSKKKGEPGYDTLCKVRGIMEQMMKSMLNAWTAGKRVTIDESMIKYMGRAMSFMIQYMPRKPIKHGIKVFACCCAATSVLLSFEVYLGKENGTMESSAKDIVERLILSAHLTKHKGRILYTDNWYTSVKLAKALYEKYRWCLSISRTDKKVRNDDDVPFLKLSRGALVKVAKGSFKRATLPVITGTNAKYYIQCTTWRDKKQVMFLHTHLVEASKDNMVRRHVREQAQRIEINGPTIQQDYAQYYSAVDINDHDSAENTVSIRTTRWYLRVFFSFGYVIEQYLLATMLWCMLLQMD